MRHGACNTGGMATNQNNTAAVIATLQRELDALREQIAKTQTIVPTTDTDRVYDVVRKATRPVTYADIAQATGLTHSVINTIVKKLAYGRKVWLSLEPGKGQRLSYTLRRFEDVATADQLTRGAKLPS